MAAGRKLIEDNPDEIYFHDLAHDRYSADMYTPEDYARVLAQLGLTQGLPHECPGPGIRPVPFEQAPGRWSVSVISIALCAASRTPAASTLLGVAGLLLLRAWGWLMAYGDGGRQLA